ncbi:hypothetical protein BOW25_10485 [Solemya velum gill symbiont]|nr:hypothetical protein AGA30_10350 [Escherichia coli]OOZ11926.1 hypothetical protein BOW25_10485 [Solemya velum gill symbiont]
MLKVLPESLTWLLKNLIPVQIAMKKSPKPTIVQLVCQYAITKNIVVMAIRPMGLQVALNPK